LVVWGLAEGATRDDPATAAILRPVLAAGFHADAILTPPQALAALAAGRRPGASGAAAWLAVNVHGAAIAIVRGHELLFARTLEWSYNPVIAGSRAQLLQRYSLVAQLAPEIRHGIAAVMSTHGEPVGTVITCGDLPELRSLTMPLIEELDLEVETLDSAEGLKAVGKAKMERFTESAPAIRLACATAIPLSGSKRRHAVGWMPLAAGIAVLAVAGWAVLAFTNRDAATSQPVEAPRTPPVGSPGRSSATAAPTPAAAAPSPSSASPSKPAPTVTVPALAAPGTPYASSSNPAPLAAREPVPTPGVVPPPSKVAPVPSQAPRKPLLADLAPPEAADRASTKRAALLKEPVPRVDSILVDQDRRLAVIDGVVVHVGDTVGARVVSHIARDGVLLREPSGLVVRLPLR
jgi:hypothetical protein